MTKMIQLEVSLRADSNFKPGDAKRLVQTHLDTLKNPVRDFQGTCVQQLGLQDHVASVRFYNGVTSIRSILFEEGSERIVDEINFEEWSCTENVQEIVPRIYKFNSIESDPIDEYLSVFSQHWLCPNEKFENIWENLYLPTDVKTRLLDYVCSIYSLRNGFDDDALISLNKLVLIYGASGTGKTSLCKALAHKAAVRLGAEFHYGVFIHLDLQGCVGYSVESGVDTSKLKDTMDTLQALLHDRKSLAFVLIENIDTFTRRRNPGSSDNPESSKSMDFIINHLDKLRRFRNVVVLATSIGDSLLENAVVDRADLKCYVGFPSPPLIYKILAGSINEFIKSGYLKASNPLPKSANVKPEASLFEEVKMLQSIADASKGLSGRSLKKLAILTKVRCDGMAGFEKSLMEFLKAMKRCLKVEIAHNEVLSHTVIRPATLTSPHSVSSSTNLEAHLISSSGLPAKVKSASTEQSIQTAHYGHFCFETLLESGSNPASVKCPTLRTEEADTNVQMNKTEIDELYSGNSQRIVDNKDLSLERGSDERVPIEDSQPNVSKCNSEAEISFAKASDQELMETSSTSDSCELNPISSHESSEAIASAESSSQAATEGDSSDSEQLLKQKHSIKECSIDLSTCAVPKELKKKLMDESHPFLKASEFIKKYDKLRPVGRRHRRTRSGSTSTSGSVKDACTASETSSPACNNSVICEPALKVSDPLDVPANEGTESAASLKCHIDNGVASAVHEMKVFPDTSSGSTTYVLVPMSSNVVSFNSAVAAGKLDRAKVLRAPPKTSKSGPSDSCIDDNLPQNIAPTRPGPQFFKEQIRDQTIKLKRKHSLKLHPDCEPEVINLTDDEEAVAPPPPASAKQVYKVVTVQEGGLVKDMNGKRMNKKMYHCQVCDFSFFYKRQFTKHQQENHRTDEKSIKYKCGFCFRMLQTSEGFRKHEESCRKKAEAKGLPTDNKSRPNPSSGGDNLPHGEEPNDDDSPDGKRGRFNCQQCDKVVFSKEDFSRHMTFHQEERPFVCSQCGKTYKTEKSLKFHVREHSPSKTQQNHNDNTLPPSGDPLKDNLQVLGDASQGTSTIMISVPAYSPQFPNVVPEQFGVISTELVTTFGNSADESYQNQPCLIQNCFDANYPACSVCGEVFVGEQELEQHYPVHNAHPSVNNDNELENEFFREQRLENEVVPEAAHCIDIETTDDYLNLLSFPGEF